MTRSSKRPINIADASNHFETSFKPEKFPVGPISLPKPGPTFANAVAAPDTDVTKSSPDNPNSIEKMPIETKNSTKNEITELKTSSSTTLPSYLGENTP